MTMEEGCFLIQPAAETIQYIFTYSFKNPSLSQWTYSCTYILEKVGILMKWPIMDIAYEGPYYLIVC